MIRNFIKIKDNLNNEIVDSTKEIRKLESILV